MPKQTTGDLPLIRQLREVIRNSGQSLNQLARASGIGPDQLSRFLRGERTLTLPAVAKVCDALGLELTRRTPAEATGAGSPPVPPKPASKPKGK